jgi:hypothetical protein
MEDQTKTKQNIVKVSSGRVGSCVMETKERCVIWDVNENIKQWGERERERERENEKVCGEEESIKHLLSNIVFLGYQLF